MRCTKNTARPVTIFLPTARFGRAAEKIGGSDAAIVDGSSVG